MKESKFTNAKRRLSSKQGEEGTTVAEICRKGSISQATYLEIRRDAANRHETTARAGR